MIVQKASLWKDPLPFNPSHTHNFLFCFCFCYPIGQIAYFVLLLTSIVDRIGQIAYESILSYSHKKS
jgi:hypothetical protein